MKLVALLLIVLFCTAFTSKKEIKIRKVKDILCTEFFTINKKSRMKEGKYYKIQNTSHDTLIIGDYNKNEKVGLWKYKGKGGKNYILYNYDNHKAEYLSPLITKIDTFYWKQESDYFTLGKVDSPPIFLGYQGEFKSLLEQHIKIPVEEMQNGLTGMTECSIIIDKDGKIKECRLEPSLSSAFDNNVIYAVKKINGLWIPAVANNTNVESKISVLIYIGKSSFIKLKKEQPYQIVININYFGITRTVSGSAVIRVPAGANPNDYISPMNR